MEMALDSPNSPQRSLYVGLSVSASNSTAAFAAPPSPDSASALTSS